MRNRHIITALATSCAFAVAACQPNAQSGPESQNPNSIKQSRSTAAIDTKSATLKSYLEYKTITLDNGLRVIMHRDTSSPYVATAIYLHVGSKDEPAGKSGFAHLFEHLHFNGTPKNPGEYFEHLNEIGGSNANGTTDLDRTNYYQTVPKNALERLLWLEADRLENILDGVTLEKLQTQIDVVKNEKALRENTPFGNSMTRTMSILFPKGHPYHHMTIGSIEDLESASIEDVQKWYKEHYGARNVVLSLAGDIDFDETEALVRKHLSRLEPGPAITQDERRHVIRTQNTHHSVKDTSPTSLLVRSYVLPPVIHKDDLAPALAAEIFASNEYSPLYDVLVNKKKIATSTSSVTRYHQLATIIHIYVAAADGVKLDNLAKAVDDVTAQYLKDGPNKEDIVRLRGTEEAFIIESSTSIATKAGLLAEGLLYGDNPHQDIDNLAWISALTPEEIRQSAQKWLAKGYHDEYLIGTPQYEATPAAASLDTPPELGPNPILKMPALETFRLSNGLNVKFVKRENAPTVAMTLQSRAGWRAYVGDDRVIPQFASEMLVRAGHSNMSRTEIAQEKARLGMYVEAASRPLMTTYSLTAILPNFGESLKLWSAALTQPDFNQDDIDLLLGEWERTLQEQRENPKAVAPNIARKKLHGSAEHFSHSEKLEAIKSLSREKLLLSMQGVMQPENSTLYVVGNFTVDTLKPILEDQFKDWTTDQAVAENIAPPALPVSKKPLFILVDDPDASQTNITAMRTVDFSYNDIKEEHVIANVIFGGGFTSRLNLNLREDKGWTYGISSNAGASSDPVTPIIFGAVTGSETLNAVREIIKEVTALNTTRKITLDEIKETTTPRIKSLPLLTSDNLNIIATLTENDFLGRPYNHEESSKARYEALTAKRVQSVSAEMFQTDDLIWTLVGDLSGFEADIRNAGLGTVEVYNLEGQKIR